MEGVPNQENQPTETIRNAEGVYVAVDEMVQDIAGYEDMTATDRVSALVGIMESLKDENSNRYLVEELARRAREVELYAEIEARQQEISGLGRQLDVHA
jgi:hypothetical protein